jgi:hypothetical protein
MEMQLSPFLSATFGIFIMQQIGRTNMMKRTAVPDYPEYSKKPGEQI